MNKLVLAEVVWALFGHRRFSPYHARRGRLLADSTLTSEKEMADE